MSLEEFCQKINHHEFIDAFGRVQSVGRASIRTSIPGAKLGSLCMVQGPFGEVPMEIVNLDSKGHVAMPFNDLQGVRLGDRVTLREEVPLVSVGESLLGEVIDSMGVSYKSQEKLKLEHAVPLWGKPSNPLEREIITESLDLGVRSINAFLTCGKGQRQGIFAGSGVGKSVLLGMMARYTEADVVVIALIGERGREVREFIENDLTLQGLKKSVVIVESADRSAIRRTRAAWMAASVAEYFKSKKAKVLLLMDSLTRFAMAQREIGIAAGEPPTTKGYPPSVYSAISGLVERSGNWGDQGSITGLYTVLVEGDDMDDPVADNARAILDGHIVLSRKLANRAQYPAVDVLSSVSRVMGQVISPDHLRRVRKLKEVMARYQENEDAIHYGMYVRGTDLDIDESIDLEPRIRQFLSQNREDRSRFSEMAEQLKELIP